MTSQVCEQGKLKDVMVKDYHIEKTNLKVTILLEYPVKRWIRL